MPDIGAGARRLVDLFLNGATVIARASVPPLSGIATVVTVSADYSLAVNDYVEVRALQDSGGALNVAVAANYSPEFSKHYVGP